MTTITIDRALLEQTLQALVRTYHYGGVIAADAECITALKAALAQEQEPGFWGRVAARQASRIKQIEAAAQQALEALINLQPIIANGLLDDHQLAFIDPHLDIAIEALQEGLAQEQAEPVQEHEDWCASVTQLLLSYPPQKAPCNCKKKQAEPVQMHPSQFAELIKGKEAMIGVPVYWAEWPTQENNDE